MITVPTTLSLRNLRKLLMLISSMKSQIRTISWLVFSQVPLLQNPWKQGVPSGRMSTGATALQEELRLRRQQRLQASALLSHMQDCSPCVSQNGMHFPARHFPFSGQPHINISGEFLPSPRLSIKFVSDVWLTGKIPTQRC